MSESPELWRSQATLEAGLHLGTELERLPGVVAAAVWLNGAHEVLHVRIHTQPGASASIVAHAATRVLESRGVHADATQLRVVPLTALGDELLGGAAGRFLVLHDVVCAREGSRLTCRVRLARESDLLEGEASELDTEMGRARAAAHATLRAAEHGTDELALGLEGVSVVPLFGRRYVAVSVEAALQRRFAQLTGMVALDPARSMEEAASLATLRAIERWIAL